MAPEVIDSHLHLDASVFDADREDCIKRALAAGVTTLISIGAGYGGLSSAYHAIQLAETYPFIWATVGVHPHDAEERFDPQQLHRLAEHPKVVAIGETGLDFFKSLASPARQYEAFKLQIEIARDVKKPLVIHSRNAAQECLQLLQEGNAHEVGGVFHCYAENAAFAARLWSIGFYVSFPGILTFKKADDMRAICAEIPLEQILIETDSPYMAPEPFRGKRCEPAFVVETAKKLALIKGITFEEVARATSSNTRKLFSAIRNISKTNPEA
jgi:TatD DNase family protein